jgi:hypothetical protein
MSRLTQLRAWWHRWREEFYEDNPISWLAGKLFWAFHIAMSMKQLHQLAQEIVQKQGEAESAGLTAEALTRLREQFLKPPLSQLPPVWTVSKGEYRWLILVWSTALILAGIALHQDWHTLVQGFSTASGSAAMLSAFVFMWIALSAFSSAFLSDIPLREILLPEGTLYIGLTRLGSQHVVYGMLAHSIARGMRRLVFYILPWLLLFGIFLHGTFGTALWFAIIMLLYLIGLVWFSHSSKLAAAGRHITPAKSIADYVIYSSNLFLLTFSVVLLSSLFVWWLSRSGIGGIALPPVWKWFGMPLFWVSLMPPMFLMLAPSVQFHPFWGIPQILVLFGLSWWMTRRAIVHLRVFRRLREQPTTTSSDEDWE